MDKIALIFGSISLYWHGIFVALGILCSYIMLRLLLNFTDENPKSVIITTVCAAPLCFLLSRLIYWYFNQEQFSGLLAALFGEGAGGYSLPGLFLAIVIIVLIMQKLGVVSDSKQFFDALAPSVALGLAIGRLSGFFSQDDRGGSVSNPALQKLPWAVYSESQETWLLATFLFEAIAAFLIFVILLVMFISIYGSDKHSAQQNDCNVALTFLSLFGVTQGVLESTRSDSLFMNSVSFVRVVQIMSLLFIIFSFVVYSVRSVKKNGVLSAHYIIWGVSAAMLAVATVMEFKMAASVMLRNYSVMATCLLFILLGTTLLRDSCYSTILRQFSSKKRA